jgi:class 3 adenylate cyclase
MEQAGESGKINVSETVFHMLKDEFTFEYRGEIEAKNKGKMKMYFLKLDEPS